MQVTQADIELAALECRPGFVSRVCPIAQAFKRMGHERVTVGSTMVVASGQRFILPKVAQDFIRDWDTHRAVRPLEFECE